MTTDVHQLAGVSYTRARATKPSFETGAKASIRTAPLPVANQLAKVWKINTGDEDADLISEDILLTDEDRKPAVPASRGCPPTKKPCANCTCGRADAEAGGGKLELTQEMLDNPQSACGSVRHTISTVYR